MNKKLIIGALAGGAVVAAAATAAKQGRCSTEASAVSKWDKMQKVMDEMPETFPPRVMFDNVAAIRENTDRMLELMHTDRTATDDDLVAAT